jgi:hypothetical protein
VAEDQLEVEGTERLVKGSLPHLKNEWVDGAAFG